jgi:2-amino-4-hydroxy-6-hydroxymethyldihydropteridine diphosphokinase
MACSPSAGSNKGDGTSHASSSPHGEPRRPRLVASVPQCVAIALGSNLGDRRANLEYAAARLSTELAGLRVSSFYETEPIGVGPAPQPLFLNAAAVGLTTLSPPGVLRTLLAIERECGRERPYRGAPRTLDLDLILYARRVIRRSGLHVPHPRFRGRAFVLDPLAEIAPEMVDPVTGLTVAELRERLQG